MSDFQNHLSECMKDKAFAAAYNELDAQYALARQVIAARLAQGLTQEDLAKRVGTTQANISKIEHGALNPSIETAQRIAAGLGKRLEVSLV